LFYGTFKYQRVRGNFGGVVMQIKLNPENVDLMLTEGSFDILYRSENQVEAAKPINYGRIHMVLRRLNAPYRLNDNYYWIANFHFEKGLRPQRFFNSHEVQEFAEKYLLSYT
jgi:hypothetical protein